jgi:chromosome segregation ATPase
MEQHEIAFDAQLKPEIGSYGDLENRLRDMTNAWGQVTIERGTARGERDAAREELNNAINVRDSALVELDTTREQLAQSNRSRDVIAQQRDRFRGEVTTCKGHIRELRSDLHRLRDENEKFQAGMIGVLGERDAAREEVERLKSELQATESALEAALDTARVFHEDKVSSDRGREGLQADLDAALKREASLVNQLAFTRGERDAARTERDLAREDIRDLSAAAKKWENNYLNAKQDLPAQANENSRVAVLAAFKDVVEAELSHWEGDTSKRLLDRALTLINNCTS